MRHGIVEGEPGVFPEPVARFFRAVGRVFGRRGTPGPSGRSAGGTSGTDVADLADLDPVRPDRADRPSGRAQDADRE